MRIRGRLPPFVLASLLAGIAFAAVPSRAVDRFVATGGVNAANDCSDPARPCASIRRALRVAVSGDTIEVAVGRYRESLSIDSSTTLPVRGGWDQTFSARDPAGSRTVLRAGHVRLPGGAFGRNRPWTIQAGGGVAITLTIDGVTMTGGVASVAVPRPGDGGLYGGGLAAITFDGGALTLIVRDAYITRNRAGAGGGLSVRATNGGTLQATLERSVVTQNRAGAGGGIHAATQDAAVALTVRDCVVTGNRAGAGGGGGLVVRTKGTLTSDARVDVVGSTINGNLAFATPQSALTSFGGGGINLLVQGPLAMTLRNAIVWGNALEPPEPGADLSATTIGAPAVGVALDHVDLGDRQTPDGVLTDLGGNVSVDPQLTVDAHLLPTSPLIDAGVCPESAGADFEGDVRPSGAGCDIGADEYHRRPNIVLLVTDDQRWDTLSVMPRLMDTLARDGVVFRNAFVPTPLCSPSRASLLTGQYAHNTGVLTNDLPDGGAPVFVGRDASTVATWLHDAGTARACMAST